MQIYLWMNWKLKQWNKWSSRNRITANNKQNTEQIVITIFISHAFFIKTFFYRFRDVLQISKSALIEAKYRKYYWSKVASHGTENSEIKIIFAAIFTNIFRRFRIQDIRMTVRWKAFIDIVAIVAVIIVIIYYYSMWIIISWVN